MLINFIYPLVGQRSNYICSKGVIVYGITLTIE